ncbi:MAG TPA: methyltransferase domain-containing protein [Dehalococcoidia bacterium]|nr:methyltransferase domain-containing protein [Dehalococcoidia bacterium]
MAGLLRLARVLGPGHLLRLRQARRVGGEELIRGFFATPTLIALLNAGLFDELERAGRVDVDSFAAQRQLRPEVLRPLCDYLYAMAVLDRAGRDYSLAQKGKLLVQVVKGSLYSAGAYAPVFHNLEALLRGEKQYGNGVQRDTALAARGSGEAGKLFIFPMVRDQIRRNGITTVLDLGCGDATFLIGLCGSNAAVSAYGVDISAEAIADGERNVREAKLDGRVGLFVEDMFQAPAMAGKVPGVQAATAFFVFHEFMATQRQRVLAFLGQFRQAFPGVPLIISESARHTPEELRRRPGPLMEFQLVHELSGQRPLSREDWKELFQEAGFTSVEEDYIPLVRIAIYTVR